MRTILRTAVCLGAAATTTALVPLSPAPARTASSVPCDPAALANAISAANTVPATLRLAPYCVYDVTAQLPQITGNVTLIGGPSTTIRHDPGTAANFRLLDVGATGSLRVVAVFLSNGDPAGDGGAVRNAGRLVLAHDTLTGNVAGDVLAPVGGNGGGLANLSGGRAVVAYTVIVGDSAISAPAETTTGNGGGIVNAGRLTVFDSRITADNATSASASSGTGNGGGVSTPAGGSTLLLRTTLAENTATNNGGGVFTAGTTAVDRTLVVRDRAALGGGISGIAIVRRSIVRGNTPDNCVPANAGCN